METPTGIPVSMADPVYDENGNLTADDTFTYAYDPLNRLVAVRVKSTTLLVAQYYYDAAGERTGVKAYNAGGTATTFMQTLRNGSDALYEKTWDLPGGAVNTEKVYLMAGGRMAVTRQRAYGLTTTYTYYGTDHLGTVRSTVVLSSTGVPQSTTFHDYEPFGVEIPGAVSYTSANTHRYTGQERDGLYNPATGATDYLDYMHFRSTAVNLGRFMRPDNINGSMTNPQSWNLYSYVHGNPVNYSDPTGHQGLSAGQTLQYLMGFKVSQEVDDSDVSFSLGVHLSFYFAKANPDPVKWAGAPAAGKTVAIYYTSSTAKVMEALYKRLIKVGWKAAQISFVPTVSETDLSTQTRANSSASISFFVYHHYEGDGFKMTSSPKLVSDEAFTGALSDSLKGKLAFVGCSTLRPASLAASEDESKSRTTWGSTEGFDPDPFEAKPGAVEYGWR